MNTPLKFFSDLISLLLEYPDKNKNKINVESLKVQGPGGGGYSGYQEAGMIKIMGAKNQNPKKSLGLQTKSPINPWTKNLPPPPSPKKKEKKKKETQTVNIKTAAKQVWL